MIDIKGLDKAEVLLELYNNSHKQGLGVFAPDMELSVDDCRLLLEEQTRFDYLYGKVMKVNLSSDDSFEEWLYDRDNGEGKALEVIENLRNKKNVDNKSSKKIIK